MPKSDTRPHVIMACTECKERNYTTTKNRIYLVGTNDGPLRRRLRAIPGVPLVAVGRGKYSVERLPNVTF
jgi:rRNA-processing protein FCF1